VKNATEFAKKFKKFMRSLPTVTSEPSEHGVIGEVIYAHLLWNATAKQATQAYKKLLAAAVDLNDLRVNHLYETVDLIGSNYPQAHERAKRLKTVLNAIYRREHGVHIPSLEGVGKREVREYFETLDGICPFVCHRVIAICYDVAAIPVDDRTLAVMVASDLIHESASVSDTAAWLSRQIKADEVREVHFSLHAWVETQPTPKPPKIAARKTIKKSSAKKSAPHKAKKKTAAKKVAPKKVAKKTTKKKVSKKKVLKKKTAKKKAAKKSPSKKKPATKTLTKKKAAKKKGSKKK
jgi:hypothetical protein